MDKIKQIIREYEEIRFEGMPRGYDQDLYSLNSALTIIGPRRAGKTTYLREIIEALKLEHFLFLNFEDERILQVQDFDLFLEAFYELYREKPCIFLDEVQNTEKWHLKVRRLIDLNYKVFLTGSNANLISVEIAAHLAENEIAGAVQVCWELTDTNRKREINGLLEAMRFFKLQNGVIVTNAQEEKLEIDSMLIEVQPAWKWALEL